MNLTTPRPARPRTAALALLFGLTLSACAGQTSPAPVQTSLVARPTIADIKACVAEYSPADVLGTREDYVRGCYQFAPARFDEVPS